MRRILIVATSLALCAFVAAGCGQFGKTYSGSKTSSTGPGGKHKISNDPFDAAAAKSAGCGEIETLKDHGRDHTTDPVKYDDNPPASGNHNPVPLDWGVYTTDQKTEKWVHNLEHGHIVILYKGITDTEQREILKYVKRDPYHMVVIPRKENPKNGIYLVAWDHRLYCAKPSAPALQEFVTQFRDQGPELFTNDPSMSSAN